MLNYESQYIINLRHILYSGSYEMNERTGIATYRLPATQIIVDLEKEFPILQSKKVAWKIAVDEILWIMQKQSNKVSELNSKIWDSWAGEDGTIGKSYGYQIKQPICRNGKYYPNQVYYILQTLANDPSNRQCVLDMWKVSELGEMNLVPCCYSSVWNIIAGRLNCMLVQRSADYPVGVPFDTTQYAVLTHMFARHLGVKPGLLTHVMADSHIYENQVEGVKKQLEQFSDLPDITKTIFPQLFFKAGVTDEFWNMSVDNLEIENYNPAPAIKYEVAV